MNLTVRHARPDDAETIARYNIAMALETEGKRLDPSVIGSGVRTVFANPGHGFYLVAEVDGEVGGCLMCTFEWSDWRNGQFWWVQSVYVAPDHRRKGLYRAMYAHLKDMARERGGVCGLRLYVEHDNRRAQETYRALGMRDARYLVYEEITPGA